MRAGGLLELEAIVADSLCFVDGQLARRMPAPNIKPRRCRAYENAEWTDVALERCHGRQR